MILIRNVLLMLSLLVNVAKADDVTCIAEAIYFEARGELEAGQKAIGQVILNRMKLKKKSACSIINEPNQFSYKKKKLKIKDKRAYTKILKLARSIQPSNSFQMDSFANYKIKGRSQKKIGNHYFSKVL